MSFRNWLWVYLVAGELFTKWAMMLFYGAMWAVFIAAAGLLIVLATAMATRI